MPFGKKLERTSWTHSVQAEKTVVEHPDTTNRPNVTGDLAMEILCLLEWYYDSLET